MNAAGMLIVSTLLAPIVVTAKKASMAMDMDVKVSKN